MEIRENFRLKTDMKKTVKQSVGAKSNRQDIYPSRPKRRSRDALLLETDAVILSSLRASIEDHLPYRRIIE
ncbi:MAG TPA: hypothetical protein VIT18_05670 [Terrimicrobiaceae bacterium]